MDFNIYRKNKSRIEELVKERDVLVDMRRTAVQLGDWQFRVFFANQTLSGYSGLKDAAIAELEKRVAAIDGELSTFGFTFDGQQNLLFDAALKFRSGERVPFPHREGKGPGEYYDNEPPSA